MKKMKKEFSKKSIFIKFTRKKTK